MRLRIVWVLALIVGVHSTIWGDVIYLKNGSVLIVQKAWQEDDRVKYQDSSGTKSIPKVDVKKIQTQSATPSDPSHDQPAQAEVLRGAPVPASTPASEKNETSVAKIRESARSSRFKDSKGYEEAIRQQESTGKPVLLYFYTDWCGYCARLERNVLSQPEVKQYLDGILYVSINPETRKSDETLFRRFKPRGFPTVLMLLKDQPPREIPTYVSPATFIETCKGAAQRKSQ